jgi:hypothetical protein
MATDLFRLLDDDWRVWRRRPATVGALARWQAAEPALRQIGSLDELLGAFEDRTIRDTHDELLLALLSVARADADATRIVLQIIQGGLVTLTARARPWWGWDDASSIVLVAALDRIARYPSRRTTRVAANLLGDVWHSVWAQREMESRRQAGWTEQVVLDTVDAIVDDDEPPRGEELMALIDEAVMRRRITARDGRLVALHRVLGYSNIEVGRIEGQRPSTIRKRRVAAEAAITALAVA